MFFNAIRKSLRAKLILASVIVEIIMLSILLSNSMRIINNTINEQNTLRFESINPLLASSLTNELFARDYASLSDIIINIIQSSKDNFVYIAVYDDDNKLYFKAGDFSESDLVNEARVTDSSQVDILNLSTNLMLGGQQIGKVRYGLSNTSLIASKTNLLKQGLIIAILEILLTALLLGLAGYFLTRHLYALIQGMSKVQQGIYEVSLNIQSEDEIGKLSQVFGQMTEAIQERVVALENEKELIQVTLESITDAVITTDDKGDIQYINPICEGKLCCKLADFEGRYITDLFNINDSAGRVIPNPVEECLKKDTIILSGQFGSVSSLKGEIIKIEYTASPIHDKLNNIIGVILAFRDITIRIENEIELKNYRDNLELLVKQRTNELELSNKELESFSYSVSHDLRAPLRSIDGFSRALEEDYGSDIDEKGKDFISRICNATERMGKLIDDLLNLARTARYDINVVKLNLSDKVSVIANRLKQENEGRNVEFIIQDKIFIYADAILIDSALENIIGNAWKYTRFNEKAIIEIGENIVDGKQIIFIKDNGVGFDNEYSEKIFAAFSRLHKAADFQGTGIGLATAERIIKRHHGSIWAEGKVNEGSTFYFRLDE